MKTEELHQIIEKFKICTPIFIALGDSARQKLILDIANSGSEGLNVTNLSAKSNLSRPAISHHLKVLKDSGLVLPIKQGTQIFYKLNLKDNFKEVENLINSIKSVLVQLEEVSSKSVQKVTATPLLSS